jgi:hypothetical protein
MLSNGNGPAQKCDGRIAATVSATRRTLDAAADETRLEPVRRREQFHRRRSPRPSTSRGSRPATGYRVRRVEIRAGVDADAQSIDELAAEPAADRAKEQGDDFEREQAARRCELATAVTHPAYKAKAGNGDDVAGGMPEANRLGARSSGNREPVDQAEHRRKQPPTIPPAMFQ